MDTVVEQAEQLIERHGRLSLSERQAEKPVLWQRAQEIFEGARAANRPMDERENQLYTRLTGAIEEISRSEQQELQVRRDQERFAQVSRGGGGPLTTGDGEGRTGHGDQPVHATDEYRAAFIDYLRFGLAGIEPEQQNILRFGQRQVTAQERRALSGVTGGNGGFLIPTTFVTRLHETLEAYFPVESLTDVITTDSGEDMVWPSIDDTDNEGSTLPVGGDVPDGTDPEFTENRLQAFMQNSGWLKVDIRFVEDSSQNVDSLMGRLIGRRMGRRRATLLTTGTGVGQPQGVTVGAGLGKGFASATAITYNELIDLEHSIDPAYRDPAAVRYMFADATLAALRKLADSQNRPLWVPWLGSGVAGAVPPTFNGYQYVVNNKMPAMTTGNRSVLFGNFREAYAYREVGAPTLFRANELFMGNTQVGFLMWHRYDGRVVEPAALKYGKQA